MKIKKTVKTSILILILIMLFCLPASAQQNSFYYQQYDYSAIESLENALSDDALELLDNMGIDASDPDFASNITAENIFSHIFSFLKSGLKEFKTAFVSLLFICVISAAANCFCEQFGGEKVVTYVSVLCICSCILLPLFNHVSTVVSSIKAGSVFMLSFVPVYSGILMLGGMNLSAAGSSATLLAAAEVVSMLASFVILPILGGYLAVGVASSVSTTGQAKNICPFIKKTMLWTLSAILTVFVGIIGLQTAVSTAADSLGTKTVKFMVSSVVPMVGPALSESLTTVLGCMKLLRSTAAVYAILALAAVFLPVLIQTVIWQLTIKAAQVIASVFGQNKISELLSPVGDALSLTLGLVLFVFALFVISLSVVMTVGGGAGV